jgi:F-type H+-transporting ATPase subunit gamma
LLTEKFVSGDYDKIELIYNQFKKCCNTNRSKTILPLAPIKSDLPASTGDYILNLQRRNRVDFDSKIIKTQLYNFIDSFASEHGARMTAMHKATDNATELKSIEINVQ